MVTEIIMGAILGVAFNLYALDMYRMFPSSGYARPTDFSRATDMIELDNISNLLIVFGGIAAALLHVLAGRQTTMFFCGFTFALALIRIIAKISARLSIKIEFKPNADESSN